MQNAITLPAPGTPMALALNSALGETRAAWARQRFGGPAYGMDDKRQNAWQAFGWKEHLGFMDYYRLWERGSLANGAVSRTISKCWQDEPKVIRGAEDSDDREQSEWEVELAKFAKTHKLWEAVREVDTRRCVGHYAGMILQIADNKTWESPVRGRIKRLVKIIPAWEGQLTVSEWDTDETSPTYGEPKMYQFQEGAVGIQANTASAVGFAGRNVMIHPDRVIILGDLVNGVPLLRAGFNDFSNIEKILGGSGESFLKNAARQLAIAFDKEVDLEDIAAAHKVSMAGLKTLYDDVTRGLNQGIDQTVVTQGAQVTPLVASVPDPEQHFNVAVMSAAASIMIPVMVWIGSQTGERASGEDQKDWAATCQGRRVRVLASDIEKIITHLVRIGLVKPVDEFSVIWTDLTEATQAEKLGNSKLLGEINEKFASMGEVPFSIEEARTAAGYANKGRQRVVLPDQQDTGESDEEKEKPE